MYYEVHQALLTTEKLTLSRHYPVLEQVESGHVVIIEACSTAMLAYDFFQPFAKGDRNGQDLQLRRPETDRHPETLSF
ncbi:hypothetical protein PSCICM_33620 [Pseudomonas cichorii]|uniref:Uncharacterized protein n=1 Tax=Pseudomonas cichorii TaxID=36746 RepID=A0ABQ1DH60_PSECI|nr:hypothetical protein PSCICJ_13100 [Pseudomonas cichorii]GFM77543.1 hypothetical protein PSCICM_33620 [Pseudomonas cichorii]GFM90346.1 hypothetical protein PSCICP_03180 [Pseudomonas cichorii]